MPGPSGSRALSRAGRGIAQQHRRFVYHGRDDQGELVGRDGGRYQQAEALGGVAQQRDRRGKDEKLGHCGVELDHEVNDALYTSPLGGGGEERERRGGVEVGQGSSYTVIGASGRFPHDGHPEEGGGSSLPVLFLPRPEASSAIVIRPSSLALSCPLPTQR